MAAVTRLLTFVDLVDEDDDGPDAPRMSVSARHEAVLADGRRVLLLDDRGWSAQVAVAFWDDQPSEGRRAHVEGISIWANETTEEIERTARDVVGPDEPHDGYTRTHTEAAHWDVLAEILQQQGIEVEATELRELPHDVELSDRVLARIARPGTSPGKR